MLESVLTNLVINQLKKNLKAENPQKLIFELDYKKDLLKIKCNDLSKKTGLIVREGESMSITESSQLSLVLTSQIQKKIKFSEIHFILSVWDLSKTDKTMKNDVYFLDEKNEKKHYSETIKI